MQVGGGAKSGPSEGGRGWRNRMIGQMVTEIVSEAKAGHFAGLVPVILPLLDGRSSHRNGTTGDYDGPEFAWKWAVAPAAIGFAGSGLGPQHAGNLFVGASRTFLDEGYLFEFKFDTSRRHFAFSDPTLKDGVDNTDYKFDEGQSGSLVAGKNFGIVTNIVTGPDGNLYVTSLSNGAVYMIR